MSHAIALKQLHRQAMLQPRLALPAGRTVSLEEGRRLAKLFNEEEERVTTQTAQMLEEVAESPVVLEESVSKRILIHRQRQNKEANVKAAVAYARRRQAENRVTAGDAEKMKNIASHLMGKGKGSGAALKGRRVRAESRKDPKKRRK